MSKSETDCVRKKECKRYNSLCDKFFEMPAEERCKEFVMIQNPDNQLMKLRRYVKEQGFDVYREYVDRASGSNPNRPYFTEMLRDARGHRFSIILATKLDRIARSMINFHDMLKLLSDSKVKFRCIDQPEISTDTSTGTFVMGIMGYVAQFERDLIRERTIDGLRRAKEQGKTLGRRPTKIDFEKVHALKAQGWGIRRIAAELKIAPETLRRGLTREGGKSSNVRSEESEG